MTRRALALAAAVACCGLLLAPAAFASEPPDLRHPTIEMETYSTRVSIQETLDNNGLPTEWKAEYITAKALEEAEKHKEEAKWIPVNGEAESGGGSERVRIGAPEPLVPGIYSVLHHLDPETAYYARFVAKNADSPPEAIETIPFTTLPAAKPEIPQPGSDVEFEGAATSDTTAGFKASIENNGAESGTEYSFEYAEDQAGQAGPWKAFTSGGSGTITSSEDHAEVTAGVAGLKPETTYYVRIKASNEKGETIQSTYRTEKLAQVNTFTTETAKAITSMSAANIRNVTGTAAHVSGEVEPHGSETDWRFEYATSVLGPWAVVPGPEGMGTISRAQAEAAGYGGGFGFGARLSGLSAATRYYVRLFAENAAGEGEVCLSEVCEPISASIEHGLGIFETSALPSARTFAVHGLQGESVQLLGGVNPNSAVTSAEQTITVGGAPTGGTFTLTFDGHTTSPLAYNARATEVEEALRIALGEFAMEVEGPPGGPYTVFFFLKDAGVAEPPIEADGSGLTPAGAVKVQTDYRGGEGDEADYRFQYVGERSFDEHGWADAEESPEMDAGSGSALQVVGAVLPGLSAGETYRYRLLARSTAGGSLVEGSEQTLTVPTPPAPQAASACPNEAFRTGLSAKLPDCRAYELVSPVDKEGAQEPFKYGASLGAGLYASEEGEHVALEASAVRWGAGPQAGGSPYFFSREAGKGWAMRAGSPQPETGIANPFGTNYIYSADLSRVAFEASYEPSAANESEDIEYRIGPAGGPYRTVASVPNLKKLNGNQRSEGWVAADGSFSKLVLQTQDRTLLGEKATGTKSGSDLYEYTPAGGLRQLNVSEAGGETVTIGSCGATVVKGLGGGNGGASEAGASFEDVGGQHSVSADGSRVFFEAVPGRECGAAKHLYMRVDGAQTVDIGAYKFIDANAEGTRLLLEGPEGLVSYDTETASTEGQSAGEQATAAELQLLGIPAPTEAGEGEQPFYHPRYTYWGATSHKSKAQAYRYDSVEHVVQCISCASSFDPDPQQSAFINSGHYNILHGGPVLAHTFTSANGEFAFFTTPAALVQQDVDGETEIDSAFEYIDIGETTSPSSDVYEWRASGVDGCAQVQGCLALITGGRGGYMNLLLGTANEGREVFIYTRSELLAQDNDSSGDIYDVRVDGGFAPAPPRPTECEASACSTPPLAPTDATPSSLTFSGEGNIAQSAPNGTAVKVKKPKASRKNHRKKRRKRTPKRSRRGGRRKS